MSGSSSMIRPRASDESVISSRDLYRSCGLLAFGVQKLPARDTVLDGSRGHGLRARLDHARIEDARDHIFGAALLLGNDARDRARGGKLHTFGDSARTRVECAAKDPRKREQVVHLVRAG